MEQNLFMALQIMWKGMAGIFTVIIIITLIVLLLSLVQKYFKDNRRNEKIGEDNCSYDNKTVES